MKRVILSLALGLLLAGSAVAQDVYTIYEINSGVVPEYTIVTVVDVIVTAVAGYGFFVQEQAGGEYSGLWVYSSSSNPPSAIIGNLVTVTGEYYEYYGYTEIDLTVEGSSVEITGSGYTPDPELVRAWEIKTANPDEAEKWECVLVMLENLEPLDLDPGYGEWFAEEFGYAENDTARFDDQFDYGQPLPGQTLSSATGPIRFSYDEFKVEPRGNYDLVFDGAEPAPNVDYVVATGDASVDVKFDRNVELSTAENPFNYFLDIGTVMTATRDVDEPYIVHLDLDAPMTPQVLLTLTVFDVQNESGIPMIPQDFQFWGGINTCLFAQAPGFDGDSSAIAGGIVTITGIVVSKYDVYGNQIYIQDAAGGIFSGMEIYSPVLIDSVEVGDEIIVGDFLAEYYGQTSMSAPHYYFEIVSSGNPVPAATSVTITGTNFEAYESMLVTVENGTVTQRAVWETFWEWAVSQDFADSMLVGDLGDYSYTPILGDIVDLTATVQFNYGAHKLQPRGDDDIVIVFDNPPTGGDMPAGAVTALGQNFPNPFNPKTSIAFKTAHEGEAMLEVFDMQGRLIRVLQEGVIAAGEHQVHWNGTDAGGNSVATGLYFYRLTTADEVLTQKMMLLK